MSTSAPAPAPVASTTVAPNSAFGGPTPAQAAAANAVIATSGASRSATTSNINTLQTALNNVQPPTGAPGSSTNGGADAQKNTSTGTTTAPATSTSNVGGGSSTATPTYKPPQGAAQVSLPGGTTGYYTPSNGTTPETMTDSSGKPLTYSQSVGGWIDPTTGAAPVNTPANNSASGGTGSPNDSAVAGLPPNMQGIAKQNLDNIDSQYNSAQAAVTAAAATLANDPALASAISTIQAKYKVLYEAMALKNQQVLGRASSSVGAFGGLGVMSQSFLSNEMDLAQTRLSDIISKEQAAIIAAQAAYNKGDVAALNAATTDLKAAQTAKNSAVSTLLTATNNAVKDAQAQTKIDNAAANSQITNDIKNAKAVAASLAERLAGAGVTDLNGYDYTQIASQLGITNPEILAAAVQAATDASTKADLSNANVANEITNRDKGTQIKQQNANKTKSPSTTFKVADGISKVTPQMKAEVKASGSTDGYIAPEKWIAARDNWQSLGGTAASFKSNFIQYLNPASYTKAGYKAPAAAAASTYSTN